MVKASPRIYKEAAKWYQKSAEHGDAASPESSWAIYTTNGEGVAQDCKETVKCTERLLNTAIPTAKNFWDDVRQGKGLTKTIRKQLSGTIRLPNRGMPKLKTIWDGCTRMEKEYPRITRKQSSGTQRLLNRGMLKVRAIWELLARRRQRCRSGRQGGRELVPKGCGTREFSRPRQSGNMYENGKGVTQDYKEALKWYPKAAEQGNAYGQNSLGIMYDSGHGVPKNHAEAVKWFSKAAEQGYADGQTNLGYPV